MLTHLEFFLYSLQNEDLVIRMTSAAVGSHGYKELQLHRESFPLGMTESVFE